MKVLEIDRSKWANFAPLTPFRLLTRLLKCHHLACACVVWSLFHKFFDFTNHTHSHNRSRRLRSESFLLFCFVVGIDIEPDPGPDMLHRADTRMCESFTFAVASANSATYRMIGTLFYYSIV